MWPRERGNYRETQVNEWHRDFWEQDAVVLVTLETAHKIFTAEFKVEVVACALQ